MISPNTSRRKPTPWLRARRRPVFGLRTAGASGTLAVMVLLGMWSAGCRSQPSNQVNDHMEEVSHQTGVGGANTEAITITGFVVAREFSSLRAPPNVFKMAGWRSSSSWTKLAMLAPEGKAVNKGDPVARFSFRHEKALERVQDRIRKAEAEKEKSAIAQDKTLSELLSEKRRRILNASTARLDTLKGGVISRRQLSLYRIAEERARFEVDAITQRVDAQRRALAAEATYQRQVVARERANIGRYERQRERYTLRAPHDGIVRHAYYRRRRRKLRKGDGMPAGLPVVLLAKDRRLAVRCFIPEHRLSEVAVGDKVIVEGRRATARFMGKLVSIERFPQEMGFLLKNDDLPNANAKAFVAIVALDSATKLAAGHEVRVRLHPKKRKSNTTAKGNEG